MKRIAWLLVLWISVSAHASAFRFTLLTEPTTLDPQQTSSPMGNYLFSNMYHGLYMYSEKRGLRMEGAKNCHWSHDRLKLFCTLSPSHKWSDGRRVTSDDYLRAFRHLIDPNQHSPQADLLFSIQNARAIWAGKKKSAELGIEAHGLYGLLFKFTDHDPEFKYKLINPALAPRPTHFPKLPKQGAKIPVTGPYEITDWIEGQVVKLKPNPYYPNAKTAGRPNLEAYFVDDDTTALQLYESHRLDFLRRLDVTDLPRFENSPELHQIPMARFDYVGFGPELLAHPGLREALTEGLDYKGFMKLFDTKVPPGCPSLPARFINHIPCLKFEPEKAKKALAGDTVPAGLDFYFSKLGGEGVQRGAEWFQEQWKKNLGVQVELHSEEQVVYVRHLRVKPPAIFRKGVGMDRPTCLAAVELFEKGNPENYIHYDDAEFEKDLQALRKARTTAAKKQTCQKAVARLMHSHRLIPLGRWYFTILVRKTFVGWELNELNQLDLTHLKEVQAR